ncbi:MAG TPA: hypothetical protein DCL38_02840 [Lachnospiraceae bacterium]|nr:hypothetical protein [Lachnospiraceae bacterium]
MDSLGLVFENIRGVYDNPLITIHVILSVLIVALLLSIYEFAVYRLVSHRAFYSRSFNICITVLPLFISTIILCLQSDLVITLGTIGALAIIRFRTAVKDPVDMLYLLWSVHTGIVCGCQLYQVGVLTSVIATILLVVLENIHLNGKPSLLVFDCAPEKGDELLKLIRTECKRSEIKTRSFYNNSLHVTLELPSRECDGLVKKLESAGAERFSIVSYDEDNIL